MLLKISPMELPDLEDVLEIERRAFSFPWPQNSFYREIANNDFAFYFVVRLAEEDKIIGFGGIWVLFDEAHITTLAVHPRYRQAGVGSYLLAHLLEESFNRGARQVLLEVRASNVAARMLYEKYDFAFIGRRKNYYYHEDALLMVHKFTG